MKTDQEYNFNLISSDKNDVKLDKDNITFFVDKKEKITSPCPFFRQCGNCHLLEIDYKKQLDLKTKFVKNLFKDFNTEIFETEGLYYPFKYRNKVHFCFSKYKNEIKIGFKKENSNTVIDVNNCIIHDSWYGVLYNEIKQYIQKSKISIYDKESKSGVLKFIVCRVIDNKILISVVQNYAYYNGLKQLYTNLTKHFKSVSLYININSSPTNLVLTDNFKYMYGAKFLTSKICDIKFNLGVKSFFQVNTEITSKIYSQILKLVGKTKIKNIIDCYSGIGITSCIFAKNGYTVQSVEIEKNAVNNAINNAKINKLEDKITFYCADAVKQINSLTSNQKSVLFVDPARNGLGKDFINNINFKNIKTIIYLSCNPKTLKEDINLLTNKYKFKLSFVKTFDMFCNTKHIEILTMLEKE